MKDYLVTPIQSVGIEVEELYRRTHNIWIGLSFANKTFTIDVLWALVLFALAHTKEHVLVCVPGRLQATNYYYFEDMSRANALQKAFTEEDIVRRELQQRIARLTPTQQQAITVASYDDCLTSQTIKRREVLYRQFSEQGAFYNEVTAITAEIVTTRGREVHKKRTESVALYLLQELPLFFGIQVHGDSTQYSVNVYPGMGSIDRLVQAILSSKKYPEITKALAVTESVGIVDVDLSIKK